MSTRSRQVIRKENNKKASAPTQAQTNRKRKEISPAPAAAAPSATQPRPSKKQRTKGYSLSAENATLVAATTGTKLPPFDPFVHLHTAALGPSPLCLVVEANPDWIDDSGEGASPLMLAPVFIHFLDDQFKDTQVPAQFFDRPAGTAASAMKATPSYSLQHIIHGVLYQRAYDHPVTQRQLTVYPARVPFPVDANNHSAAYDSLARTNGVRMLEPGFYFRFGVRVGSEEKVNAAVSVGNAAPTPEPASSPNTAAPVHPAQAAKKSRGVKIEPVAKSKAAETEPAAMPVDAVRAEKPSKRSTVSSKKKKVPTGVARVVGGKVVKSIPKSTKPSSSKAKSKNHQQKR